jgi:putative hemolysin
MGERNWSLMKMILLDSLALAACQAPSSGSVATPSTAGLANPASIHCQEQGGTHEMRQDGSGGTFGVCVFSDGSECEEWAFFNGECQPGMYQQAEDGLNSVNVVKAAGLEETVSIDIRELSLEPADEPYGHLLTIDNEGSLEAIIDALNVDIRPGLRLACIPIYQLIFHLANGSTWLLEYSCGEDQGNFMRGGQPLVEGKDYVPPVAFNELLRQHIQSTWAQSINPTQAYGLDRAVELEILESIVTETGTSNPQIVTSQMVYRLETGDPAVIASLVELLDADYDFAANLRCPAQYVLIFTLDGGSKESFGYLCRDAETGVFRGDQAIWKGRVIEPPVEFLAQLEALLDDANWFPCHSKSRTAKSFS